ncbi:MAG TPA: secondary thiamine-phosphate synthase enzyme YjbQ [Deltaproteobacteria bacterium]|jgi:secondary thiamine-phosphate synthase enzyme|nr:secondary thiamine-phosphate synthase enzyme YjbQ [Deltaproteobacteria bacterium]HRR21005.1 secondary thiamine-phosphate synthase enzyme YjbQ [Desulfomonilia bacterium]HPA83857.1 secondary thiamine-phosphate synthase enzyme YjbQ [Deltaproteobacteria bacterium]HPX50444.1 secondary thiamine-phosphate synthase enzyme YjbQ [Deltaproteobacteria bacterium]HQO79678.1 secondary thiamine-phosphate synthase enzyme YjbQ [Deltaproteobacteria bacterium]
MLKRLEVKTSSRVQLVDITSHIKAVLKSEDVSTGVLVVYVPHTTCGLTINENADPAVKDDIITMLDKLVPLQGEYQHIEGNSAAHIKASLMGSSITVIIESGALVLGTWQGIFLAEFDGPRKRSVLLKIIPDRHS